MRIFDLISMTMRNLLRRKARTLLSARQYSMRSGCRLRRKRENPGSAAQALEASENESRESRTESEKVHSIRTTS